MLHEPLAQTDRWRVRVVGAEEDLFTPRVQQLGELVELLRPAGLKDVLAVLVHQVGAERAAAEQPHRPRRELLAMPPGERHGRLQLVEHVRRTAENGPALRTASHLAGTDALFEVAVEEGQDAPPGVLG